MFSPEQATLRILWPGGVSDDVLCSAQNKAPFASSGQGVLVKAQVGCPLDICLGILSRSWSNDD